MSTVHGWDTVEGRWLGVTWYSTTYTISYVTNMVFHIPIILATEPFPDCLLMLVHHLVSVLAYSHAIFDEQMLWWGAVDGLSEITTIFMNNLYIIRSFDLKDKIPTLTLINGFLFWFTYIPFRLVLFPLWLYGFYYDIRENADIVVWDRLTTAQKYLYPFTNILLLVLSIHWFIKITRGVLKLWSQRNTGNNVSGKHKTK